MAIQTLKKTRLQKCLVGCSVEDVDSSVHVVEVNILSESTLLHASMYSTTGYCIVLHAARATCFEEGGP